MSGGRVVHVLSHQPYDFYIGRANPRHALRESFWANPYKVGPDGDLQEVLAAYEEHARRLFRMYPSALVNLRSLYRRGVVFGCWCAPKSGSWLTLDDTEICHGQTLLRLAAECDDGP